VVRGNTWFRRNANTSGGADITFAYGNHGANLPLVETGQRSHHAVTHQCLRRACMLSSRTFFPTARHALLTWLAAVALALVGFAAPASSQPAGTMPSSPASVAQSSSDNPAVVRDGVWYLRNSNTTGIAHTQFRYGNRGDLALMGDWNGDGVDTPGVVRGNTWYLRNSNTTGVADVTFAYGNVWDIRVVGDWDGDGTDTPGVVRDGVWYLRNSNTTGTADVTFAYGNGGEILVVGDWDGDGTDTPGVVRHPPGVVPGITWYLRNSNTTGTADTSFAYGNVGDIPLTGDWDGDGVDTPGVVRLERWSNVWHLRNSNTTGRADTSFTYGNVGADYPLSWHGEF
jgi:hypothetical protein